MTTNFFGKILAMGGAIAAVAAVCVSINLNPPSAVKAYALDQERLQSLQQIDFAIKTFYRNHHALPERFDAIANSNGLAARSNWKDPLTHQPYEYDVVSKTTYQLCANFSADSGKDESPYVVAFRNHHKGHDCFQQDVNAE